MFLSLPNLCSKGWDSFSIGKRIVCFYLSIMRIFCIQKQRKLFKSVKKFFNLLHKITKNYLSISLEKQANCAYKVFAYFVSNFCTSGFSSYFSKYFPALSKLMQKSANPFFMQYKGENHIYLRSSSR